MTLFFSAPQKTPQRMLNSALAAALLLALLAVPAAALARRGADDANRTEVYGLIEARPQGSLQGEWVIGGQTFVVDEGTEFDFSEGPLEVGRCAKVHLRSGRVHEIDSEPLSDCR